MNARLNFNELLKLYKQGMRKKEIQRVTHITDNEYICFLNATQRKRAAIKYKDKQDKLSSEALLSMRWQDKDTLSERLQKHYT